MNDDRIYSQRPVPGGFHGYNPSSMIISFANDPVRSAVFVLLITLFFLMLLAGGICIWPYLFTLVQEAGGFDAASSVGKLLICGGISALAGALVSLYLCWFHEWMDANDFSFSKIFMIVYISEVLLSFILIPAMGVNMLGVDIPNVWTNVLSFLFHSMLGMLLSMVPSLLVSVIGYLANWLNYQILRRKERSFQ